MTESEVIYEVDGGVATATINRPDKRNSLSATAIAGLADAVASAADDPAVRVLVLTGAGDRAFCAGADLTTMFPEGGDGGVVEAHDARGSLAGLFRALWDLGKPTVARVRGYALAGGFGLAMACDLVIAADDAVFGTPEITVGLWPFMITVPLLKSMPAKVALDLMMTGRRVGAAEGLALGFVSRVVPVEDLDAEVGETTRLLASRSPSTMRLGRGSFYRSAEMGTVEALEYLQAMLTVTTMTGDAAEGIAAFVEKREPRWTGK